MANPTRILFVSGEVDPFTNISETAQLVRTLPEKLQETGNFETRIMMPRYGTISERRNRLHEVIRLSGTDIPMGEEHETLRVKVASIPGIRLQVYFMDNSRYFKRKGVFEDKHGKVFEDNAERALFFGRAVLATISNLGWGPDVVHAFGRMSAFLPLLLRTEYASEPLFEKAKVVYTPDNLPVDPVLSGAFIQEMALPGDELDARSLSEVGRRFADAVAFPPSMEGLSNEAVRLSDDPNELLETITALYEQVQNEVPA
jgi:starch synthase